MPTWLSNKGLLLVLNSCQMLDSVASKAPSLKTTCYTEQGAAASILSVSPGNFLENRAMHAHAAVLCILGQGVASPARFCAAPMMLAARVCRQHAAKGMVKAFRCRFLSKLLETM